MSLGENRPSTGPNSTDWAHAEWADLVQRLSARRGAFERYTVHEEVGRGGMGRVLRVRDEDLHRDLAMKVMQCDGLAPPADPSTPTMHTARFVEEAQVAGQLDHPGIVPVHEMGLDAEGQFYFTMKLVRGRTLEGVLELARNGTDGWSTTRVLHVLLRVCEAMGYAHERGVLHRDLKPSNIMLGDHGEVYVMDWGLARLLARPDHALPVPEDGSSALHSARSGGSSSGSSSPFVTENDRVVGTPTFMSPEQAVGASAVLNPQSDIYSVGAILYTVLTGRAPYSEPGKRIDNRAVWVALHRGPPQRVAELARGVAPELVSICEKAMARELHERYATMSELAEDLRAYLELRVVKAHRTGPWHELKKWVGRNKAVAVSLLALFVVISAAGFTVAASEHARARESELRADVGESSSLLARVDQLGPIHPASLADYDDWLTRSRRLTQTLATRAAEQAERALRADSTTERPLDVNAVRLVETARSIIENQEQDLEKAKAPPSKQLTPDEEAARQAALLIHPEELRWRRAKLAELEARLDPEPVLRFTDRELQTQADEGHQLLRNLYALERVTPRVERHAQLARDLRRRTLEDEASNWSAAVASIADASQCPRYAGLKITPQIGLVPLGRNRDSGLWEFWHVLSGERPVADGQGNWIMDANTGMVLVLIPGGTVTIGAQSDDATRPRFDSEAEVTEALPLAAGASADLRELRSARLDPYFVSKYEMTQGQWLWVADEQPSKVFVGRQSRFTPRASRANPVEDVDWVTCTRVLAQIGLVLPTEVQWEHAARGGTELRYLTSDDFLDVHAEVNFGDRTLERAMRLEKLSQPDDGFAGHIKVDAFKANGFGLFNVLGNVSEWCRDWYADKDDATRPRDGDGEIRAQLQLKKSVRGGSFLTIPKWVRVSARSQREATAIGQDIGLRPARALDP
ncbi:MAG: SUMF1/EgtB/PvdO family nonheme iron enzyme [Planctomycetes bacterium]|nr:SUMF1/EgtB/PvdO family nonheme iron enzyme [Planctomycetota bacterium]